MGKVGQIFLTFAVILIPWILAINILRVAAGGTQLYVYTILDEFSKVDISFSRTLNVILTTISKMKPYAYDFFSLFENTGNVFADLFRIVTGIFNMLQMIVEVLFLVVILVITVPLDLFEFVVSVVNLFYFLVGIDNLSFNWHWNAFIPVVKVL